MAPIGLWRGKTGCRVGPGEEKNGPARRFWAAGKKEKKGRGRWVGPKTIGKEREVFFFFFLTKRFNQFNSNLREFKFKLDN